MRKCIGCGRTFNESWRVCLYCAKPLVSNTGGAMPAVVKEDFKSQLPKPEEVIKVIGTIVKGIAYVIGGILLIIGCIVAFCFAMWVIWAILNIFFGDHD